jgi:hypothetical protein
MAFVGEGPKKWGISKLSTQSSGLQSLDRESRLTPYLKLKSHSKPPRFSPLAFSRLD